MDEQEEFEFRYRLEKEQAGKKKSGWLENAVGSVVEPIAAVASGMVAKPISDVIGLAGTAANAMGFGDDSGDVGAKMKQYTQDALTYQPRSDWGKAVAESQYNPVNMIGNAISTVADTAAKPVRGDSSNPTREAAGNFVQEFVPQAIGLVGMKAAPKLSNAAKGIETRQLAELNLRRGQDASRVAALQKGFNEGYSAPEGVIRPGAGNSLAEGVAHRGHLLQSFKNENYPITQSLAKRELGLPDSADLTQQAARDVRAAAYQEGYVPIASIGKVTTDATYAAELNNLLNASQKAQSLRPVGQVAADLKEVGALLRPDWDASSGLARSQELRNMASKEYKTGDPGLGKTYKAAAKAIEDQIERHLAGPMGNVVTPVTKPNGVVYMTGKDILSDFRDARKLMAKAHVIEDATVDGVGLNAAEIARRRRGPNALDGNLATIGDFANVAKDAIGPPKDIPSPGVGQMSARAAFTALGAGAGSFVGAPLIGAAAAAVPFAVPPILRKILLNKNSSNALADLYKLGFTKRQANNLLQSAPYMGAAGAAYGPAYQDEFE